LPTTSRSPTLRALRNIRNDALYRGSLYLLANTVATSAIGFVFWTLAAHRYSATTVGVFAGVTSGATLLAAIAALGLPLTMTRHIARAEDPIQLVLMAVSIIATVGTILCLATVLFAGPLLPPALHIKERGGMVILVTVLVVFTAVSGTLDAGLIATRSSRLVLIKNLVGSIVKLVAMLVLSGFTSSGLLISFGLGLVLATALSGAALGRQIKGKATESRRSKIPWRYLSHTSSNYLATVIGITPLTIVPLEVLIARGAADTARFSIAFLIAGFLNFIPSTTGQVLFAEIARGGVPLGRQLRKALRAVYGLLLPSLALLLLAAPLVLRLFGQAYASEATGCLRVLALSALPAGGTYLVDSILIARDRTAAYTFMQVANATLVLGCVQILLSRGLTAAAGGWALAQALTLVLGLIVLATGTAGRHHVRTSTAGASKSPSYLQHDHQPRALGYAFESQIRALLATWPMMPTTLIAERIRWDQSIQILLDRVTELRATYSRPHLPFTQTRCLPGETAECSLWFPPIELPVGFGQTRTARQLPVLTMITGYSRWLSAILIPSTSPEDLFAGWWSLVSELGGVPHTVISSNEGVIDWRTGESTRISAECHSFFTDLGAQVFISETETSATTNLIQRANAYLERSLLRGRAFGSPQDFNAQLCNWLEVTNTRPRQPPSYSPAELITADKTAMRPLPTLAPTTGWHLPMRVGHSPFVRFDSNDYSVHPSMRGRPVELFADLSRIRVMHNGVMAANHERAWTNGQIIRDPKHRTDVDATRE
jgi:O-antigen/teichoic acid export membrane protein